MSVYFTFLKFWNTIFSNELNTDMKYMSGCKNVKQKAWFLPNYRPKGQVLHRLR